MTRPTPRFATCLMAVGPVLALVAPARASEAGGSAPVVYAWRPLSPTPAPDELADALPARARLVEARSGDLLRLQAAAPPTVGRLFRGGRGAAFLDESDRLVPDGPGAFRYAVPLGTHVAVVIAPAPGAVPPTVARAEPRDVGYAWEAHEDELVRWADEHAPGKPPPLPPSLAAQGAWIETSGAAALLDASGALETGGRHLEAILALEGIAAARPLVAPYYRPLPTPIPDTLLSPRHPVERRIAGPAWVEITARARRPLDGAPRVTVRFNGRRVEGGPLPAGPRAGDAPAIPAAGEDLAPATWVVRVPAGRHTLSIAVDGGAAIVAARAFRKREHVRDALRGEESLERRRLAAAAAPRDDVAGAGALVLAESQRLGGDLAGAARAFGPLVGREHPVPVRVYAAWRIGELTLDPDDAERMFSHAESLAKRLGPSLRERVAPALARARARRAIRDGLPARAAAAVADHAILWSDPALVTAVAGHGDDHGAGVARLAALIDRTPGPIARAVRRAFFDATVWTAPPVVLEADAVAVLARDRLGPCSAAAPAGSALVTSADSGGGDAVYRIDGTDLTFDVPPDPLGAGRHRVVRLIAATKNGPALDAVVRVEPVLGGEAELLPVPTVLAVEEHRLALAPGRYRVSGAGGAHLFLVPPANPPQARATDCPRYRRRRYVPVEAGGRSLPIVAAGGALLGIELRLLGPSEGGVVTGVLEIDGRKRPFRYLAVVDESALAAAHTAPVSSAVRLDTSAARPDTLRVVRSDSGGGTLLLRALVRAAPPVSVPSLPPRALVAAQLPAFETMLEGLGGDPVLALRRLGREILAAPAGAERSRLRAARAALLARLGRFAYAEEDLRAAAADDPARAQELHAVLRESARYVAPARGRLGYPLDPSAPILYALRRDPTTLALARRAHGGDARQARARVAQARRASAPVAGTAPVPAARADAAGPSSDGALALAARFDDAAGDAVGAAAAYAELARRRPHERRLLVAEAARRLDGGGSPTRALVAALLAGDAPGAADARARALDATRWRTIQHAQNAAGSWTQDSGDDNGIAPDAADPALDGRSLRPALVAPDADPSQFLWLEPGLIARAVVTVADAPALARVDTRCADLRPQAARDRQAPPSCRFSVRVDGRSRPLEPGVSSLGRLAPGTHAVEIVLAPGGQDVLAGVRLLFDRAVPGSRPAGDGVFALIPRRDERRWLAERGDPVRLDVLGPTALRVDGIGEAARTVTVEIREPCAAPLSLLRLAPGQAGRAVVALPEERRYRLELAVQEGRAALAVSVREDRAVPARRPATFGEAFDPDWKPSPPPAVPALALREVVGDQGAGTVTLASGLRDGAVGERDTTTERGGRYGQVAVTYRRRSGDAWWRADAFGRLRPSGDASGGLSGRGFVRPAAGALRFEAGALGVTQSTETGLVATTWLDAALSARLWLGGDWFLSPAAGGRVRLGPQEDPGGDALDPDLWSPFDAAHHRAAFGQLRLDFEPFLDLRLHGRVRATTNADLASLDRAGARAGLDGALARLAYGASLELERRLADEDRPEARTRFVARLDLAYGLWRGDRDRFSVAAAGAWRPGDRSDVWIGLAYDLTFGRGLRDFAPDETTFAGQLGPYEEKR